MGQKKLFGRKILLVGKFMGQKMILVGKFVGRNCFWSEFFLISEFFCLLENYLVGNFFGWTIFLFDNFVGQGGGVP